MIDEAAARVGAPARLMRAMAGLESGLNATAKASTSSATGLYQFIEATWLSKVERDGHKYGLGQLAKQIRRGPSDEPIVDDLRVRDQILALRKNARLSAYLAAELTIPEARARVLPAGVAVVAAIVDCARPERIAISHSGLRGGLPSTIPRSNGCTIRRRGAASTG